LDMFCKEIGIKAPSASTIARIIKWLKDRGEILDPNVKVSLYGRTGKVDISNRYNIPIIEDSAQALGARYKGQCAGTFGFSGNFSFYPSKALGAFGDAGAVVTNDEETAKKGL